MSQKNNRDYFREKIENPQWTKSMSARVQVALTRKQRRIKIWTLGGFFFLSASIGSALFYEREFQNQQLAQEINQWILGSTLVSWLE